MTPRPDAKRAPARQPTPVQIDPSTNQDQPQRTRRENCPMACSGDPKCTRVCPELAEVGQTVGAE